MNNLETYGLPVEGTLEPKMTPLEKQVKEQGENACHEIVLPSYISADYHLVTEPNSIGTN